MEIQALKRKAQQVRCGVVDMIYTAQTGHIGGALSEVEYLVALYYAVMQINPQKPADPMRDRFILSKGHCVEPLLCILADKGFFAKQELQTFCRPGTRLIGHPSRAVPGIEMSTGALGHGLSGACGMALAAKKEEAMWRVFCLMGDGELAEGSVWEAAMFASHYALDNLYVAIDRNRLQISGSTESVMGQEPLAERFAAFGFEVTECDGNDIEQVLHSMQQSATKCGKPHLLILNTIKGKGVSFMENEVAWHHGHLTKQQHEQAMRQLQQEGAQ